jgi:hypothetical protein
MRQFNDKLTDVLERQHRLYEPYQTLCEMENVSLADLKAMAGAGDLHRIPAIPAEWFKKIKGKGLFRKLANFQEPGSWLVSSSTSGDSSYTWRTPGDRQTILDSFECAYRRVPIYRSLAFSPDVDFLRKVGQRFAIDEHSVDFYATIPSMAAGKVFTDMDYMVRLNTLRTIWTMLRTKGKGRPVLDLRRDVLMTTIQQAQRNSGGVVFSASVLMLYPTLKALPGAYPLGSKAFFMTGAGGWDGKKGTTQGERISKPRYVEDLCAKFQVPEDAVESNFWDIYGTTENGKAQIGPYSREHEDFVFEVGDDVSLYVIDPVSGRPAQPGEKGFPRFVSPRGVDGFAGACIQQNDIVTVVALCDDGSVKQFTHISRASGEEGTGGVGCAFELVEGVQL